MKRALCILLNVTSYSVNLFDELKKAHEDFADILIIQIMDHGRLGGIPYDNPLLGDTAKKFIDQLSTEQ